jgi:hypothetical protein
VTLEDGFNTSDFNQYDANPSGKNSKGSIKCTFKVEERKYYRGGHGGTIGNNLKTSKK